jgi:TonB family protein
MTVLLALLLGIALAGGALPLQQVAGDQSAQVRCAVPFFRGAGTPEGATATMTTVSDGRPCGVMNWGVPTEGRNPATDGRITQPPKHGTAMFVAPRALYSAESGYVGDDEFAYEATVTNANGATLTMHVKVTVDVRAAPFAPPVPAGPAPIRVGGNIPPPRKIKDVKPVYPPEAQQDRVQGMVMIEATIDPSGRVSNAIVRRSIPQLDAAAIAAVRQWEFTPTVVNGTAVPVVMTVTVSFNVSPPSSPPPVPNAPVAPPAAVAATSPPITAPPTDRKLGPDFDLGAQALQRKQWDEALRLFRRANDANDQKCGECFLAMARAYEGMGAAKNAIASCDRAMEVGAGNTRLLVESHQTKGTALLDLAEAKDMKKLAEAETEFRAALQMNPDTAYLHFNLGVALMQERRDAEGITELQQELALRSRSPVSERAAALIANPRRAREPFAPDFSLVTLGHELVTLGDLRGKVVVLDFWGTWCPPCVQAVPELRDLQKKHGKEPFVLIGVSSDSSEQIVRDFTGRNQMEWTQFWDRDRKIQQIFEIRAWPTYIVIDDEGIMRLRTSGTTARESARLSDEIRKLMKAAKSRIH